MKLGSSEGEVRACGPPEGPVSWEGFTLDPGQFAGIKTLKP